MARLYSKYGTYSDDIDNFEVIATLDANQTTYLDKDVEADKVYFYRIQEEVNYLETQVSAFTEVTLPKPENFRTKALSIHEIQLHWNYTNPMAKQFVLERASENNFEFIEIATLTKDVLSYQEKNLIPDICIA